MPIPLKISVKVVASRSENLTQSLPNTMQKCHLLPMCWFGDWLEWLDWLVGWLSGWLQIVPCLGISYLLVSLDVKSDDQLIPQSPVK
jgi:hypothetical protein